jgi:outer membrane protein
MTGHAKVLAAGIFALLIIVVLAPVAGRAQEGQQPPPFTVPNPPTPAAPNAPGQQPAPAQQQPNAPPDAPLPQPDRTTVDHRDLKPLSIQSPAPAQPSAGVQHVANDTTRPQAESPSPLNTRILSFFAPYHPPRVPELSMKSPFAIDGLVREGKLYLSLHDAIVLAVENSLDVEISRYDLLLADTDLTRA